MVRATCVKQTEFFGATPNGLQMHNMCWACDRIQNKQNLFGTPFVQRSHNIFAHQSKPHVDVVVLHTKTIFSLPSASIRNSNYVCDNVHELRKVTKMLWLLEHWARHHGHRHTHARNIQSLARTYEFGVPASPIKAKFRMAAHKAEYQYMSMQRANRSFIGHQMNACACVCVCVWPPPTNAMIYGIA